MSFYRKAYRFAASSLLLIIILASYLSCTQAARAKTPESSHISISSNLDQVIQSWRGYKKKAKAEISIAVVDAYSGSLIFNHNALNLQTPASVAKLMTTYAALKLLGPDFRIPTELYADKPLKAPGENIGNLYLRGYGDPSLVEEQLFLIADRIRQLGVTTIENIVVDDQLFRSPPPPTGNRPYQAGASALSINHNCIAIHITPTSAGEKAIVRASFGAGVKVVNQLKTVKGRAIKYSADLLEYSSIKPNSEFPFGKVVVKGVVGEKQKPTSIYRTVKKPSIYTGILFKNLLVKNGTAVKGSIIKRETPEHATLLYTHRSKPVSLILRDLNHYSNNFIGEQLVFLLGQENNGYFKREKGLEVINSVIKTVLPGQSEISLEDGSGLSRKTKFSAASLALILAKGWRDFSISPEYLASISRFGSQGTLKKRNLGQNTDHALGKTGTLRGVSSLAGYASTSSGRVISYAIILNGKTDKPTAKQLENELVEALINAE